jgi:hypothetical protein
VVTASRFWHYDPSITDRRHEIDLSHGRTALARLYKNKNPSCGKAGERGGHAMEIVAIGLGFMFAIWIAVIWGSAAFTRNMQ